MSKVAPIQLDPIKQEEKISSQLDLKGQKHLTQFDGQSIRANESDGSISFLNDAVTGSDTSPYVKRRQFSQEIFQLFVQCEHLPPQCNNLSKIDPLCVLFVKRYGEWTEYARTETIANCHDPKFVETFYVDKNNPDNEVMKFSVYDSENLNSKDLHKYHYIGSSLGSRHELKDGICLEYPLTSAEDKDIGKVSVWVCEVRGAWDYKKQIHLKVGATKLVKRGIFSRVDAFLQINRKITDTYEHPVYRSELILKNPNPRWSPFTISLSKLMNANYKQELVFQVLNYNSKGDHEILGRVETTVKQLLSTIGTVKKIPLKRLSFSRRTTNKYVEKGKATLNIYQIIVNDLHKLTDYIKAGVNVQCSIAIDFTYSNGEPLDKASLHYLNDGTSNQYINVLHQVGAWMSHYCEFISLYGFGATMAPDGNNTADEEQKTGTSSQSRQRESPTFPENNSTEASEYCFKIERNLSTYKSIEEIIATYKQILPVIIPGGPTYYKNVLQKVLPYSKEFTDKFHLVLLISDGVNNDENELKNYLVSMKSAPCVIVIIGVGPCNFNALNEAVMHINKRTERQLVFFLSLSKYSYIQSDVKELYARISQAIVNYFTVIKFQPSLTFTDNNSYDGNFPIDTDGTVKNVCPTCGSSMNNNTY